MQFAEIGPYRVYAEQGLEQFTVFRGVEQIGFIRLKRHVVEGYYPDFEGKLIYDERCNDDFRFAKSERVRHITKAIRALDRYQFQVKLDAIVNPGDDAAG